jgi:hypothetical protein
MNDDSVRELLPPIESGIEIHFGIVQTVLNNPFEGERSIERILAAAWLAARSLEIEGSPATNVVEQDFNRTYVGTAHQVLHHTLSNFDSHGDQYAAVFPILQSSGVGKTRTVVKLADHAPGILLCVRPPPRKSASSSMPRQDKPIYDFLTAPEMEIPFFLVELGSDDPAIREKIAARWREWHYHLRFASLLAATVAVFRNRLAQAVGPHASWQKIVEQLRHDFTDNIVTGYHAPSSVQSASSSDTSDTVELSPRQNTSNRYQSVREASIQRIATEAEEIRAENQEKWPKSKEFIAEDDVIFRSSLMSNLESVLNRIMEIQADIAAIPGEVSSSQYFYIALDEFNTVAHLLTPARRVMSALVATPLRLLLLDTNNQLASVMGPDVVQASDRTAFGEKVLCEPHLVISHDIQLFAAEQRDLYYRFLKGEESLSFADCRLFMRHMGRPLWSD